MTESNISNIPAECALLGAVMIDNRLIDAVSNILKPEDFHEQFNGRLWSQILQLNSMGKRANPVTLKPYVAEDPALTELGGIGFLAQLTGSGAALVGAIDIAEQVAALGARRRFSEAMLSVATACEDFDRYRNLNELAGLAEGAIADALRTEGGTQSMSAGKAVEANLEAQYNDAPGVLCGIIPSLDHALGAICPGDLSILASRPGMGKTALAISYAHGVAEQGHGVTFASLEMRAAQLGGRLACDVLYGTPDAVPYRAVSENRCSAAERRALGRVAQQIAQWPLWIEDLPAATVARLGAIVRKHKRRLAARDKTLRLVIVDYLQLLAPDHRTRSLYEATSLISRGLKALAKAEDVGMLALCQLSRDVERRDKKRPKLSDLRDSGQIEQDADSITFLLREAEYMRQEEPPSDTAKWIDWQAEYAAEKGRIEFIVAKRRAGQTSMATGLWHGDYQAVRG